MRVGNAWAWWSEMRAIAARHARRGACDAPDDLAQDMAVAALEEPSAAERPGAWLERVGRNAAVDRWRVEHRRAELAGEIEPPPVPLDPEATLLARERRGVVRRALLALPRPQRRAALLRFHGGLPFEAVAARLGTEPGTARTRVHRALASLRAQVRGLRVLFVGWHGAQAAVLSLALVAVAGAPFEAPIVLATADTPVQVARPSGPRRAAPPAPAPTPAPPHHATPARPQAEPAAVQHMIFGDDLVSGGVTGPEGEILEYVPPAPQPSLIEIRRDFLPETVKSLEEL